MPALSRATGIAAVALVAVVGVGALMYLNSRGGPGGPPTFTNAPTTMATPQPTMPPGISGWKTYTSPVYGYTLSYPDDWSVVAQATQKWQPGETEDAPSKDVFFNNQSETAGVDNSMAFEAAQFTAPAGADLGSWDGLLAALAELCDKPGQGEFLYDACPGEDRVTPMCLGSTACVPAAFVHYNTLPRALFGDPEAGTITYIRVARVDDFPAAARYGGTEMLLKSILGQLGVREPRPGEIPS